MHIKGAGQASVLKSDHPICSAGRWVIKVGSSLVTNHGQGLDRSALTLWVHQVAQLLELGKQVILVSSGAVAEGVARMGWCQRPTRLHELQAAAAVGQMGLIQAYESLFQSYGLRTAQILLTHEDLSDRKRYLNARSTLLSLLGMGVIPVVNENDTVVSDEIRFGDNDRLAALVTNLVEAQVLAILTDQSGMYTADPSLDATATLITQAPADDVTLLSRATGSLSGLGRGGMVTKVEAAQLAARSGAYTFIGSGRDEKLLVDLASGSQRGTLLVPSVAPLDARKRWILGHLQTQGALVLDEGAARVIRVAGKSLLSVGITGVEGRFQRGDVVECRSPGGDAIAKGLVNYASNELVKILKTPSSDIESKLGYKYEDEVIHRDNLVSC